MKGTKNNKTNTKPSRNSSKQNSISSKTKRKTIILCISLIAIIATALTSTAIIVLHHLPQPTTEGPNKSDIISEYLKIQEPGYTPAGFTEKSLLPPAALPSQKCQSISWALADFHDREQKKAEQIIKPTNDIYTVFDEGHHIEDTSLCYRTVQFNDKYFDAGYSLNASEGEFIDTSPTSVKTILLVLALTERLLDTSYYGQYTTVNTFYSYNFVESDNKISLELHFMAPSEGCHGLISWNGDAPTCEGDSYYRMRFWKETLSFNGSQKAINWPAKTVEEKEVEITHREYESLPK